MSDLRTLFPDTRWNVTVNISNPLSVLYVYNSNITGTPNGGQCCLWTVPAGATWAKFEVWGGGGPGGGACCCQQGGNSGGAGSYARKTIQVTPGQTFTICAGGSTCCFSACQAPTGFPSYACNASATPCALCLCASGGLGGFTQCFVMLQGCYHCITCICGSACGHDFALCGATGASHNTSCGFNSWNWTAEPTYVGGGLRIGQDHCRSQCGTFFNGCGSFPGGGGGNANTSDGGVWCGGQGVQGLVVITYK